MATGGGVVFSEIQWRPDKQRHHYRRRYGSLNAENSQKTFIQWRWPVGRSQGVGGRGWGGQMYFAALRRWSEFMLLLVFVRSKFRPAQFRCSTCRSDLRRRRYCPTKRLFVVRVGFFFSFYFPHFTPTTPINGMVCFFFFLHNKQKI